MKPYIIRLTFGLALVICTSLLSAQCGGGPCEVCNVSATITSITGGNIIVGTSTIPGQTQAGQTGTASSPLEIMATNCGEIEISVELDFDWDQGVNNNWIHGISYSSSPGWTAAQGIIIPPDPGWLFFNSITGLCSGTTYGAGFYWDPPGVSCAADDGNFSSYNGSSCSSFFSFCESSESYLVDGDPSDNWGIDCTTGCPKFGFDLTYCPLTGGDAMESISFFLTEDGETGAWGNSDGCVFQLDFPINILAAGTQLPDDIGPICEGECVVLDAGAGCDMYSWSTMEVGQMITVCPTTTTTYGVTLTGGSGCVIIDDVMVAVEFCCDADAGEINAQPIPACPNELVDWTISNYLVDPDYGQIFFIADANGDIVEIFASDMGNYTSNICSEFTLYSYNYFVHGASFVPSVGDNVSSIDCSVECCDLIMLTIRFEDTEAPTFDNPPADITYDCNDQLMAMLDLSWTDNCDGNGMVSGMQSGASDLCNGGTITRVWEYEDACMNIAMHTQTITINPVDPPTFINPPADETVSCSMTPTMAGDLAYTNGGTGMCLVDGIVSPTESGSSDLCGGTITYTWDITDLCLNTLTHTQSFTIDPAPEATFINPPIDMTITCDQIPSSAPDLMYSNNELGDCLIEGIVSPIMMDFTDECGGTISFTWETIDDCMRTISHIQTFNVDPSPQASFINPPGDITVSCDMAPSSAPDLMYSNNKSGVCLIEGTVSPTMTGSADECGGTITFIWEYTDDCMRLISHTQNYIVDPAPEASFINPPSDISISCDQVPSSAPDLMYSNNETGNCLIEGIVSPIQSGMADECGGTISFTWEFIDQCGRPITHTQNYIVDPAPSAVFSSAPPDGSVSCEQIPSVAPNLFYSNNEIGACLIEGEVAPTINGSADECGGSISYTWQFTDNCNRTISETQTLFVAPAPEAHFIDPPIDITVSCEEGLITPDPLEYSNETTGNCSIEGSVIPSINGTQNACGGELNVEWFFEDDCGRSISHIQNIMVDPAPMANFVNPPSDITLNCDEVPLNPPSLSYTNNATGVCLINGLVPGLQSGNYNECGGQLSYNWTFTDECGRTINETQNISINPAADPVFIVPPADVTLDCHTSEYIPPILNYSNGEFGICEISGISSPSLVQNGNVFTYTWTFNNPCSGLDITHVQNVTISLIPDLMINPISASICQGDSYNLLSLAINDLNNTNPNYTFHDDNPPGPLNEIGNFNVTPFQTTTYYVLATNSFGCTDFRPFELIVDTPPFAGNDGSGGFCNTNPAVNLFDYLENVIDFSGAWEIPPGINVNISNPMAVNFMGVPPGVYDFIYTVSSNNSCPDDSAIATIEIFDELNLQLINAECNEDFSSYTVIINGAGADLIVSQGDVSQLLDDLVEISNIPIDQDLIINAVDPITFCFANLFVSPPNCNCPTINPPISNGDAQICEGEMNVELSVTVGIDETTNWYDSPSGGNLIQEGSTSYTPIETMPGIYTYYVQSASTALPGCFSNTLTEVVFEIIENPVGTDAELAVCESNNDGLVIFDLSLSNEFISTNSSFQFKYYASLTDAENGVNELNSFYTNSSPWSETIFVKVINSVGCFTIVMLDLIVLEQPNAVISTLNEVCFGDMNGMLTINSSIGNGNVEFSLNGIDFQSSTSFSNLSPGDFTMYIQDDSLCTNQIDFTIEEGVELTIEVLSFNCNDNGTNTDPNDDFQTIDFQITNNKSNQGSFNVLIDNIDHGTFTYGSLESIQVPADNSTVTISFVDVNTACNAEQNIGPLNSCSTNCVLSFDLLEFTCNGNGTESDPSDDFYDISILVTAVNGAANNTYNVLIDGVLNYNFTFGVQESFTLNADNSSPIITIIDNEDNQCQNNMTIGPLSPCSSVCVLEYSIDNIICNNQETENDENDDTFTFELTISGVNVGPTWTESAGAFFGNYDDPIVLGPYLISDGLQNFIIQDINDGQCLVNIEVSPPAACSSPCVLELTQLTLGDCNDNNTGNIEIDDFFSLMLMIEVSAGTTNQFIITINNIDYGPYTYDELINIDNLPSDGNTYTAEIIDINFGQCAVSFDFTAPTPCSLCNQTVDAGDNVILDCNQSTANLFAMASEMASYEWTGPNFFFSDQQDPEIGSPGTYIVSATFDNGCTAIDSLMIIVDDDVPVASAGPDQFITCLVDSVLIETTLSNSLNIEIEWTDENGNLITNENSFYTQNLGSYFLQLTDTINNCSSALDAVEVIENTDEPLAIIYANPGNLIDCVVQSISLTAEVETNVVYTWTFDNVEIDGAQLSMTQAGTIGLNALDTLNGCDANASLEITDIQDYPLVSLENPDTINCSNDIVTINGSASQVGDNIIYIWYDEDQNIIDSTNINSLEIFNGGLYYLELIDTMNGCSNIDSVLVESLIELPNIEAGADIYLGCEEINTNLQATLLGNLNDYQISWISLGGGEILNGDTGLNPEVEGEGVYIINVLNTINQCESSDTVFVYTNLEVPETALISSDNVSCFGESDGMISVENVIGGEAPYLYSINGSEFQASPFFAPLSPGSYVIEIIDNNGCSTSVESIIFEGGVADVNLDTQITLQLGESTILNASTTIPEDSIQSISWTPDIDLDCNDCLNPELTANSSGTYTIEIIDLNGCITSASIELLIEIDEIIVEVYIPNIISANSSQNGNDKFTVFGNENLERIEEMYIFDRWGEKIFEAIDIPPNDPNLGWDGSFKGQAVQQGVYVYLIKVRHVNQNIETFKGDVSFIR